MNSSRKFEIKSVFSSITRFTVSLLTVLCVSRRKDEQAFLYKLRVKHMSFLQLPRLQIVVESNGGTACIHMFPCSNW